MVRETVLDVRLPKTTRLDRIEVRRIRMPGHAAGLHVHKGPVLGSIVDGSVVYQVEGEQRSVLGPGEVFHEPEGARIARFDAGDEGVTFLAYFLLSASQEPAIEFLTTDGLGRWRSVPARPVVAGSRRCIGPDAGGYPRPPGRRSVSSSTACTARARSWRSPAGSFVPAIKWRRAAP